MEKGTGQCKGNCDDGKALFNMVWLRGPVTLTASHTNHRDKVVKRVVFVMVRQLQLASNQRTP